jgi:hypothetical protein
VSLTEQVSPLSGGVPVFDTNIAASRLRFVTWAVVGSSNRQERNHAPCGDTGPDGALVCPERQDVE